MIENRELWDENHQKVRLKSHSGFKISQVMVTRDDKRLAVISHELPYFEDCLRRFLNRKPMFPATQTLQRLDAHSTVYALHEQLQNISCSNDSSDEPLSQPRSCGTMSILQHKPVPKMNQCMTLDANAFARSPLLSLYTQIQGLARPFYQTLGLANAA